MDRPGSSLPSEEERATKSVKNKDGSDGQGPDQVIQDPTPVRDQESSAGGYKTAFWTSSWRGYSNYYNSNLGRSGRFARLAVAVVTENKWIQDKTSSAIDFVHWYRRLVKNEGLPTICTSVAVAHTAIQVKFIKFKEKNMTMSTNSKELTSPWMRAAPRRRLTEAAKSR
ncbi:hypothetical protein V6N13_068598 [Hibiscus sabdariffa]|uniref:Uncharacterized protein n=1 Tax=Hibiscus sabdariffa TaxID=183260 RepID=A0ABR2QNF4_9ROSI